jgi:methyl-accepting chemotaxis protein WspA
MNFLRRLLPRSIAGRLTAWFLLLALLPSLLLVLTMFFLARQGYEQLELRNMQLLLRSRLNQVETLAHERLREAEVLSSAPVFRTAIKEFLAAEAGGPDAPTFEAARIKFAPQLQGFLDTLKYPNLALVSPEGKVWLPLRETLKAGENLLQGPFANTELAKSFRQCLIQTPATISPPDYYPASVSTDPVIFSMQTIVDQGKVLGVLLLQLDTAEFYRYFKDYEGLGTTGEAKLARKFGSDFVVLNPLRDDPQGELKNRRIPMGSPLATAVQWSVDKKSGVGGAVDWRGKPVLAAWGYAPTLDVGVVAKIANEEAFAVLDGLRNAGLGLLALTAALAVPFAFLVARGFSRPIGKAVEAAKLVAAGDLTETVKTLVTAQPADGEIGLLQSSVAEMTDDLRDLMKHIQQSIVTVMSTSNEIAAVTRQQEQTIQDHGSSTMEVAAAVNQISATSQELLRTMSSVQASASQAGDLATRGQAALTGMHQAMNGLSESTGSISSRLSVISERANNINLAVTTITKVADQTNLLSINAAIEAEKAGEAGRGFLVVAREIRRLADQTAAATLEIERIVKEMQQSVTAGVMEMDKFNEQVRRGVDEVGHIESQLGEVIHAVQDLLPRFHQVNEGMAAQSQGAEQIREAMTHLSEGASRTSDSIREFHKATEHLRESIDGLKNDVAKFRT